MRKAVAAAACTLAVLAGCTSTRTQAGKGPESRVISVGVVPAISNAGIWIAEMRNLFVRQGLTVQLVPITSSADVLAFLLKGRVDILAGNYVSEIQAQAGNPGAVQLRILAEGALTAADSRAIMVPAGSPVKTIYDLKGKTIAVNALNNAASLLVLSALYDHAIPVSPVRLVPIGFPYETAALQRHEADAAWMTEPFITAGEKTAGLHEIYDTNQGATNAFPIDGYTSTKTWARTHPRTVAAFLRALEQGQKLAELDRPALNAAMTRFLGVPPALTGSVAKDEYPAGPVSLTRMQRVADSMVQWHELKEHFNMAVMVSP